MDEGLAFLLSLILSSMLQNFDDMITETRELLTLSVINDSLWDNISNVARSVFVPFGTTIIVICLMIEIAQTASRVDLLKWEHAIKIGVKMVLTKVAVDNVSLFLEACYKQSIRFINSVPNDLNKHANFELGSKMSVGITQSITGLSSGWSAQFGVMAFTFILWIVILLCGVVITALAFGRVFELLVYVAISPIPIAFLPLSGGNENYSRITINFLKNFIAVSLQGVLMYLNLIIYGLICDSRVDNFLNQFETEVNGFKQFQIPGGTEMSALTSILVEMAIYSIIMVLAMAKCGSWAKSAIDAH